MENDISLKNKKQIENSYNNQNDILNKFKLYEDSNIANYEKQKNNSEFLSIFDKYKLQNAEGSSNDIKENKNVISDKTFNNKNEDIEQEMIRKNNDYTKQINEIINKNFKKGLDISQNIDYNLNLNNNSKNKYNKYLELDRERKLLLLKNIELEKEINNLNNFVDIESKFNQNKIRNNRAKKTKIDSYNNKTQNKNTKMEDKISIKDIKEAQRTIKLLDKKINKLKQDINMNYINNNKHQEKIKEVKIWRETFYEEFFKYKNLLKDLKENLNKDKIIYYDVISKMREKATDNVKNIFENYKNQIIDNEKKLNFLKMENEKLVNKENNMNINNNNKNEDIEKEMIRKNNTYTEQINEIISKNFKQGLNISQNKYNKYLELDRERKLLLLKNIELEKEINNLNNFVDIESKFNQNKIKYNKQNKKSIENINNKIKYNNTINNKSEDKIYIKEIKSAQNMIKILDKRINKLKQDINMNYNITKNKHQEKIKEVKIWRETFYEEFIKYKNLLKDLKQNLSKDKIIYNNVISNMKQKASENINNIFENYKSQIIDNEKRLNFLKIENEKLTNKENKVKEVYLYNFN